MKRSFFLRNVLFFAPALLLAGCAGAETETPFTPAIDAAFSATAKMEYGEGQTALLHLTRCTGNLWEASFEEPPALAGVMLTFDGDQVTASYKGLEFTVPKSALPAKNMLVMVTEAVENAAAAGELPCTEQQDGSWCYAADCTGGAFTLTFSDSGEPLVFDLPAQPLKITFSEYTCITTAETTAPDAEAAVTTETAAAETDAVPAGTAAENNEGTSD